MRIIKKLSYEARLIKFIQNAKMIFSAYEKKMGKNIIHKQEFLRAVIRIKSSLVALKNNKLLFKKTKNKQYKTLIRHSIKAIKEDKRKIKTIIEMNKNYYYTILFPKLFSISKTR